MFSPKKAILTAVGLSITALSCAQDVHVQIDGSPINFPNAQPQKIHGRVLVPMRRIFEQLGATVDWDKATQSVTAEKGGKSFSLTIGKHTATVDGSEVRLDVPAMIVGGSTMVPIRFVSEALGAQVGWLEVERLVSINMGANARPEVIKITKEREVTEDVTTSDGTGHVVGVQDEVIPFVLDHELSNTNNSKGDTFTATLRTKGSDHYGRLPRGTKLYGHVAAITTQHNNWPAVMDLAFDRLVFPNGNSVVIHGTLNSLDSQHVTTKSNGTLEILNRNDHMNERMVIAGFGDGTGRFVEFGSKGDLVGATYNDAMGDIVERVPEKDRILCDIHLDRGTQFGVRLSSRITVNWQ